MAVSNPLESTQDSSFIVGAVGHRGLPPERWVIREAIDRVFAELAGLPENVDRGMELVVSVAEGADRLFIEAATTLGIPYTCVLPCSPNCFEIDFAEPGSVEEFRMMLAGAQVVIQPECDPPDRLEGYVWASNAIVNRSDVLVAVWDGEPANGPAGTGDSIRMAWEREISVIWIPDDAPHEPVALAPSSMRSDGRSVDKPHDSFDMMGLWE